MNQAGQLMMKSNTYLIIIANYPERHSRSYLLSTNLTNGIVDFPSYCRQLVKLRSVFKIIIVSLKLTSSSSGSSIVWKSKTWALALDYEEKFANKSLLP